MLSPLGTFCNPGSIFTPWSQIEDVQSNPLYLAVEQDDCETMEILLSPPTNLNQPALEDALGLAAIRGREKIVEFMLKKGISVLGALNLAIKNRQMSVVKVLLDHGEKIENTSQKKGNTDGALDLFFSTHDYYGEDLQFLEFILLNGAKVNALNCQTIFKIGVYASSEELGSLIEMGFDPRSRYREENRHELKNKRVLGYIPEVNLLDLAVIQAERANLFKDDLDSIKKVALLLEKRADPFSSNNYYNQSYLHRVSHPRLVELFCKFKADVKKPACVHRERNKTVSPIGIAHTVKVIKIFCDYGANHSNAPFSMWSQSHKKALKRIGFNSTRKFSYLDEKGELLLMKAAKQHDIAAFVALIGEGIDVNQPQSATTGKTCLHLLFAAINEGSVDTEHDYIALAQDFNIRLINILIKHGAAPLKDAVGRTPLMCLTFNPFNKGYNDQIIDIYINFEANHYNLDPDLYRSSYLKLRKKGLSVEARFLANKVSDSMPTLFEKFWNTFKNHSNPTKKL